MSVLKNTLTHNNKAYFSISACTVPFIVSAVLIPLSFFNFLLFHTLAEFFAITIAILTSVVAWNMYPFTRNNYLMYIGSGYFWIGALDLLHAMSYKGMKVIPGSSANMGAQFWIGTRYLEALLLLSAPWFLTHSFNRNRYFISFGVIASIIASLVYTGYFPDAFVPGTGLTNFKIYSEYFIVSILAVAIYYLYSQRAFIESQIVNVLIVSIVFTMFAELAFTFYVNVYGLSNIVGHIFKIFSYWFIFQAVITTTLKEPFLVMSKGASTYDAIPDATIVVDENGIIRQANNEAHKLSNYKINELIGKNNHEIFHAENVKIEHCLVCQAIINSTELRGLELEIDENKIWYDFSLSKIIGASNLNGTVEVIRDISQRKRAEKKVKELDILKNSIVDNLPNMLFVKDVNDHRYVEWNKAAEELTGLLKEEMVGNNDFDFWPEEQAQFFIDKDNEVIQSKKLFDIPQEPITTKFKGTRTVHTKKIPIFDDDGNAKYLLGISEDVTDKIRTEEMLRHSQKMEAVGQMSGGIAHDFNNQLGVILGYTELLLEQPLSENQINWLKEVRTAADRCVELTQQLLIFSRKGKVDKKVINVNTLFSEMEVMIKRTLTPEIDVKYYFTGSLWPIEVNPGACKDVMLNLVLNARDAMPDGGSLTIETSNSVISEKSAEKLPNLSPGEYVQIMISDSGHGMSKAVYERIFEPFFTTKEVGKGTGLGLSMVYGFVHRYGGDILLDTNPGEGATFRIYLPRVAEYESETEVVTENKIYQKGHENILIVEDETALAEYAEEILKERGYTVYSAANAADALTILENTSIDLLFTDIVMPGGMSGYELAEKATQMNANLKVLVTSGFADKVEGNEKYAKYEFELISKPYNRDDLLEKLRLLLVNK